MSLVNGRSKIFPPTKVRGKIFPQPIGVNVSKKKKKKGKKLSEKGKKKKKGFFSKVFGSK